MSKLAKKPLPIPEKTEVEVKNRTIVFRGVKGEITLDIPAGVNVGRVKEGVKIGGEDRRVLGLFASLVRNAMRGVSEGFQKELELVGVGYKVAIVGDILKFTLGYSHPIEYKIREDVKVAVEGGTRIIIEGVDKQKVGQVAAKIRKLRPPEPYKGKGIRYVGEVVRRKRGKVMKVTTGGV